MPSYLVGFKAPLTAFDKLVEEPYELVPLEYRHLTLLYIGPNPPPRRDVEEALAALSRYPEVDVTFRGLRPFPSFSRPRYLAAVPEDEGPVRALRRIVEPFLLKYSTDRYTEFKPHVTIARSRAKPSLDLEIVAERIIKGSRRITERLVVREVHLLRAEGGRLITVASTRLAPR